MVDPKDLGDDHRRLYLVMNHTLLGKISKSTFPFTARMSALLSVLRGKTLGERPLALCCATAEVRHRKWEHGTMPESGGDADGTPRYMASETAVRDSDLQHRIRADQGAWSWLAPKVIGGDCSGLPLQDAGLAAPDTSPDTTPSRRSSHGDTW